MATAFTVGSLFDGSGGFPLAGKNTGFSPIWASEIEPFPIFVTRKNLPEMEHLGDITAIDGSKIPPVDVITFGSPCTDLSVAGKREGLSGKASSLFFEAIRVIAEMRQATGNQYPKFCIWENVPGAFSSNKGRDFYEVIQSFIRLCGESLPLLRPPEKSWSRAGLLLGGTFSLAWRVLDAQYFDVPQRRKRIYFVVDFGGDRAGKILFESKSLHGADLPSGEKERNASTHLEGDPRAADRVLFLEDQGGALIREIKNEISPTLRAQAAGHPPLVFNVNSMHEERKSSGEVIKESAVSKTLDCHMNPNCNQGTTLIVNPVYGLSHRTWQPGLGTGFGFSISENIEPTLLARGPGAVTDKNLVRRLTPLECSRLQGFPDTWTDSLSIESPTEDDLLFWRSVWDHWNDLRGVKRKSNKALLSWLKAPASDAALYKMWGNGIALPCAEFVLKRIQKELSVSPTNETKAEPKTP